MMHPKRISISISATATKVLSAVILLLLMGGVPAHGQKHEKKMNTAPASGGSSISVLTI